MSEVNWFDYDDIPGKGWRLGDYNGESCEQCGRERVCVCDNGRRCEKCSWSPDAKEYVFDDRG